MNAIIYIEVFIIGIVFGSFFTLAVHRIPIKQDILYTRSYCPKCNHRLEFLDLIPVASYIFLKGKCRYCKEPIRIRYFLLEVLSGIAFLTLAVSMNLNIYSTLDTWISFIFTILNFIGLFITIGIYKQYKKFNIPVLIYLVIVNVIYNIISTFNLVRIISLIILIALIFLYWKSKNKSIMLELLISIFYFLSFHEKITIFSTILLCFFISLIVLLFYMIKSKIGKKAMNKTNVNSYIIILLISNIISIVITNFYIRWHI